MNLALYFNTKSVFSLFLLVVCTEWDQFDMPTNKDGGGDVPFSVFVKKVRNLNKSIRWVGIANQSGIFYQRNI